MSKGTGLTHAQFLFGRSPLPRADDAKRLWQVACRWAMGLRLAVVDSSERIRQEETVSSEAVIQLVFSSR